MKNQKCVSIGMHRFQECGKEKIYQCDG